MDDEGQRQTLDLVTRYDGPWDEREVARFLMRTKTPMRLAVNTPSGFPAIVSLWFLYEGDALHAAVHESAKLVKRLRDDPRCTLEVAPNEPPYHGVRIRCFAELSRDEGGGLLRRLLVRYLGTADSKLGRWLLSRADGELHITLRPVSVSSWDYRERMKDASAAASD
ncbi:MAG: pyridoxamine 5'-phosphate oxidase family protein [Polyangiales bacterium]